MSTGEKPPGNRVFHSIQITDDEDLLFLYVVEITEQDFLVLKQDQCLKVDYQEFPMMLTHLFESCLNSTNDENETYRTILDLNKLPEAHFSIVEEKRHKSMPHLVLKLKQANDEQTKKHLSYGLTVARKDNERLDKIRIELSEHLQLRNSEFDRLQEQLKTFEYERNNREAEIKSAYEREKNSLISEKLSNESRLISAHEQDKKMSELKYSEKERVLGQKAEKFENMYNECNHRKMELESEIRELAGKYKILDKENLSFKMENDKLRAENSDLTKYRYELEREVASFKVYLSDAGALRDSVDAARR